jgi:hypothetical protein
MTTDTTPPRRRPATSKLIALRAVSDFPVTDPARQSYEGRLAHGPFSAGSYVALETHATGGAVITGVLATCSSSGFTVEPGGTA